MEELIVFVDMPRVHDSVGKADQNTGTVFEVVHVDVNAASNVSIGGAKYGSQSGIFHFHIQVLLKIGIGVFVFVGIIVVAGNQEDNGENETADLFHDDGLDKHIDTLR
jgi:hypothetical protein